MLNKNEIEQIERYISGIADANDITFVEFLFSLGILYLLMLGMD